MNSSKAREHYLSLPKPERRRLVKTRLGWFPPEQIYAQERGVIRDAEGNPMEIVGPFEIRRRTTVR